MMKRHKFALRLALTVLTALGLGGASAAGEQVPFKGTLDGVVTITGTPPIVSVVIDASGNATQLGEFTLSIPHIVDRNAGTATGTYEFQAANGDTLTAEFSGQSKPSETPGVLFIVETATITGGTGRFADATGSFTAERFFNTAAGTTTGSFDGTISTKGSARP
jgi:hypothetical protein